MALPASPDASDKSQSRPVSSYARTVRHAAVHPVGSRTGCVWPRPRARLRSDKFPERFYDHSVQNCRSAGRSTRTGNLARRAHEFLLAVAGSGRSMFVLNENVGFLGRQSNPLGRTLKRLPDVGNDVSDVLNANGNTYQSVR